MGDGNSSTYRWIYDPVGDPEYPYVLAELSDDGYIIGKDENGNILNTFVEPTYHVNYSFEGIYKVTPPDKDPIHYNLLGGGYAGSANKKYLADIENFWGGMQFDIKAGAIYRGISYDNQYIKYVVAADATGATTNKPTLTTDDNGNVVKIKYGIDPYFILGGGSTYRTNYAYVSTGSFDSSIDKDNNGGVLTYYHDRVNVVVLDFDFGTDSAIGYPQLSVQQQTRYASATPAKTGDLSGPDGLGIFSIAPDGVITPTSDLNVEKLVTLNPAGEWNHVTAVFYTDPAANDGKGIAYYYINGELLGTSTVYRKSTSAFIQGMRFNASNVTQNVGASVAFDNVSYKVYSDYLFDGECDGAEGAAGTYLPESYCWITAPAKKYVADRYTVNGVASDLDINEAIAAANEKGASLKLVADVIGAQKITTNGYIATNGYNIEIDPDSYGYATTYDANGNEVYYFNEAYNQTVEYKFYAGSDFENYSDDIYESVEFKYGNTPDYDFVNNSIVLSDDGRSATGVRQIGWVTESGNPLEALTLDMIAATKDTGVKVYPVFEEQSSALTAYVKSTETGKIKAIAKNNADAEEFYKTLGDDDTYVFLSDAIFDDSYYFYDDSVTETVDGVKTVNGVVIDNDYTDEEIDKMREVAQHINVDLNGYTVYAKNRFACISGNTVYNLTSSVEGGTVCSLYTKSGNTTLSGQRTLAIIHNGGGEGINQAKETFNAHLNATNITVVGGFPVEGTAGDDSCSLTMDESIIVRAVNDSDGAIMCRYFYGNMKFTNTIIVGPTASNVIDVRCNGSGEDACDPTLYFENCKIINKGGRVNAIKADGGNKSDASLGVRNTKVMTFVNCEFSGRFNPAENGNVFTGEGTAAAIFATKKYSDSTLVNAAYNVGMTLGLDSHYLAVMKPVSDASSATGFTVEGYYYFVDYGYKAQFMAEHPDVSEDDIVELPLLTEKTVKKSDAITVTYENLDGTTTTQSYAPGGYVVPVIMNVGSAADAVNTDIVAIGSKTFSAITLMTDGSWADIPDAPLSGPVTVHAGGVYAVANLEGIKANLSVYSEFGVNVYLPIAYKDYVSAFTVDGKTTYTQEVDTDNDNVADFIKVTAYRAAKDAASDVCIAFAVKEDCEGTVYEADASVTISVVDYASKVLSLESATDADKALMYQMLTYANEAIKYAGGEADAEIAALIGENTVTDYTELGMSSYDTAALSAVFAGATVDTDADLAYVLALKEGFVGTVTVKNGDATYTFEVDENDKEIRISGMKVYNFAHDLIINAEGTIGGVAASVTDGRYNLATFTKYHVANAETSEESAKCVAFAKAFYNYVMEAKAYIG